MLFWCCKQGCFYDPGGGSSSGSWKILLAGGGPPGGGGGPGPPTGAGWLSRQNSFGTPYQVGVNFSKVSFLVQIWSGGVWVGPQSMYFSQLLFPTPQKLRDFGILRVSKKIFPGFAGSCKKLYMGGDPGGVVLASQELLAGKILLAGLDPPGGGCPEKLKTSLVGRKGG